MTIPTHANFSPVSYCFITRDGFPTITLLVHGFRKWVAGRPMTLRVELHVGGGDGFVEALSEGVGVSCS